MVGEDLVAPLFLHGAAGADVAVVEGVMGLYDGRGSSTYGSTAHVARLLDAPVVLVVDASSQSRSVAALVHGFASYDPSVRLAGVVLNRVGSDRHEQLLREALDGVAPVLGVLRRAAEVATPSRHLGLVPVAERAPEAIATVRRLGELCAATLDLDALLALARSAPSLDADAWVPPLVSREARPVVAVAGGEAFTFSYAETVELLEAAGADVVVVDPLRDDRLPEAAAGLVIGGGFPEVYAEQLSANDGLRTDVARLAAAGAPVSAECAGLLYLCRELDGLPMCGVLPAVGAMTPTLQLGYRDATGADGTIVTGHEFHRTAVVPRAGDTAAWRGTAARASCRTACTPPTCHLHWAGVAAVAESFVAAAVAARVLLAAVRGAGMRLIGVGVGPGDPSWSRSRASGCCSRPTWWSSRSWTRTSRAAPRRRSGRTSTTTGIRRLVFALDDRGGPTGRAAVGVGGGRRRGGRAAAEPTAARWPSRPIGDPNVYSTFTYLADAVLERVPGVESAPSRASRHAGPGRPVGTVLCEGTESLPCCR
jgi:cobyrinic acid a,c-diamide synthase